MKPRLIVALFVAYLVLLTLIILWKLEPPYIGAAAGFERPWKLVPFFPSGDANASNPLEVLANVALFVPFGLYLGLLAPKWRWRSVAVFAAASLWLEVAQHLLSVGSFDTSDLIANTVGGAIGLLLVRRVWSASRWQRILVVGSVVCVVAIVAYLVSPLHFTQPRDYVVR